MVGRSPLRRAGLFGAVVTAIALAASACGPAAPSGRYADAVHAIESFEGLTYGSAPDEFGDTEFLELDLYRPSGVSGPLPAIVFVHGGGFNHGSRAEYTAEAKAFARRGYVTATIDYRVREDSLIWFGAPSAEALEIVTDARHDAQASVRWLRENADTFGVDPHRIAMVGYSAGAITAVGVGQSAADPGDSGSPGESSEVCLVVSIAGTSVVGDYRPTDARLLMLHGADDFIVPTAMARTTAFAAGVDRRLVGYHEFAGIGHLLPYQRPGDVSALLVRSLRDELVDGPGCA